MRNKKWISILLNCSVVSDISYFEMANLSTRSRITLILWEFFFYCGFLSNFCKTFSSQILGFFFCHKQSLSWAGDKYDQPWSTAEHSTEHPATLDFLHPVGIACVGVCRDGRATCCGHELWQQFVWTKGANFTVAWITVTVKPQHLERALCKRDASHFLNHKTSTKLCSTAAKPVVVSS